MKYGLVRESLGFVGLQEGIETFSFGVSCASSGQRYGEGHLGVEFLGHGEKDFGLFGHKDIGAIDYSPRSVYIRNLLPDRLNQRLPS